MLASRLPAEVKSRLDELAQATDRELAAIRAGKPPTVPREEVMKRHGLQA